jgi:hypothetical protein
MSLRTLRIEALKFSVRTRMNVLGADSVIAVAAMAAAEWLECDRGDFKTWRAESWLINVGSSGVLEELNKLDGRLFISLGLIYAETVVYSVRWVEPEAE